MSTLEFQQQLLSFHRPLYHFALSLTRNRDEASDLLQESMVRALTYRGQFRDNTNFKAWLCTIMKNTFINEHRRAKRAKALLEQVGHAQVVHRPVQVPASTEATVRMAEIQRSLDRLDPAFRAPFTMHHEGYKYHEIADALGIPLGTVKSRIFEARHRLMGMLTDPNVAA